MAAVLIKGFAGMRPAMNPRLLETGESQLAKNAKLNNGSLRAMKNVTTVSSLAIAVQTIYRYGDTASNTQYWLQFAGDVDVIKSPVHDDQYRRLYWSDGTQVKYAPEGTFLAAPGPFPTAGFNLGIPKPGVALTAAGSAVPVYTKEKREYVLTYTTSTEETRPSSVFTTQAVDGFNVKLTGLPAAPTGFTGKKLYRRDANVNGSVFKLVASLAANATEYTDSVLAANLGATLSTTNVADVPVPQAPGVSHPVIDLTASATTRYYAYTYGGYYTTVSDEEIYVDELQLSSVASISVDSTQSVTLSSFSSAPAGAGYRRIYRRDTASGVFIRIAQIPVSQTTFVDSNPEAVGTGPGYAYTSTALAAPTLTASASTAVTNASLTTFVYAFTYVNSAGTEGKRSPESNAVKVIDGVTTVTVVATTPPTGVDKIKIYRRTATVTNGVLGGSDTDYRLVATVPASQLSTADKASAASIASNGTLPVASTGTGVTPTSAFASGEVPDDVIPDTRVYVYTYVSAYGEEGPPSDASTAVDVDPSQAVSLTNMATSPGGSYNVTAKRIYRSSTGTQSTAFQFVAEIPVANTSYSDTVDQADLGEILQTEGWVAPPAAMKGLTLGANGIAAGFKDKTLYLSESFLPHAWPSKYQQTTEHAVVGIGAFQQSFAVLTTSYPYVLSGSDPGSMSMVKLEAPQACVSKRSICSTGTGVVYASPDGLVSIGVEGIRLLTAGLLNREQWQAYTPSSMLIKQYNSKIYVFHATGLIVFDFTGESASMTVFDATANAAYYDPISDSLFIALNGVGILKWDSGSDLSYTWKSKLFTLPQPVNFGFAQVEADAYPVTCKVYAGGVLKHTQTVANRNPFRLPSGFVDKDWEVQLEGTGQVFQFSMAQSIAELRIA